VASNIRIARYLCDSWVSCWNFLVQHYVQTSHSNQQILCKY